MYQVIIKTLTIVALGIAGVAGYSALASPVTDAQAPLINTGRTTYGEIINKVSASGEITTRNEVFVDSEISGVVLSLNYRVGDTVRAGEIIAAVIPSADAQEISEAKGRYKASQVELERSWVVMTSYAKLHNQNLMPEIDYLTAKYDHDLRKIEVATAKRNLGLLQSSAPDSTPNPHNIIAPIDGTIVSLNIVKDGRVWSNSRHSENSAASAAVVIADMRDMVFNGMISESSIAQLDVGMEIHLTVAALNNLSIIGHIEAISPKGERSNSGLIQFPFTASIQTPPDVFLRSGYSATADIITEKRANVLTLPEQALHFENNTIYVVANDDNVRSKMPIEVGISDGLRIEVLNGLAHGTEVVLKSY